jgi:hypothetical protein
MYLNESVMRFRRNLQAPACGPSSVPLERLGVFRWGNQKHALTQILEQIHRERQYRTALGRTALLSGHVNEPLLKYLRPIHAQLLGTVRVQYSAVIGQGLRMRGARSSIAAEE